MALLASLYHLIEGTILSFCTNELVTDNLKPSLSWNGAELTLWTFLLVLFTYLLYYQFVMVKKPKVVCHDPVRLEELKKYCPVFFEKYQFTPWAPNAYMQSVGRAIIQTYPKEKRRRELLKMKSDGGQVCLDWFNEKTANQPTMLILPGMTGSSDENYIRHWIRDMTELGYRSVVFNYRGCNHPLITPKMYSGGSDIEDLSEVVSHIRSSFPHAPLMAVSTSLGTSMLLTYSMGCKENPFCGLILFSVIWDAFTTVQMIQKPLCKYTLNRFLSYKYTKMIKENREVFEESERKGELRFAYKEAIKIRDLVTLMEKVVAPMFGSGSWQELLKPCYSNSRVNDLTIPILGLNASDDPFQPPHAIPEEGARSNHNLMLVTTERGGHIGFMEGLLPLKKTFMDRALMQFATAVFEHRAFQSTQCKVNSDP